MAYSGLLTRLPGVVPMGLEDWQGSLRDFVIGQGTRNHVMNWGEFGSPEMRTADMDKAMLDGTWLGVDNYGGLSRTLDILFIRDTAEEVREVYNEFMRVWRTIPGESGVEFWTQLPGTEPLRMIGRPRRVATDMSGLYRGKIRVQAEFYSPLSALFGGSGGSSVGLATTTGTGRSYNLTYDRYYDLVASGGSLTLTNEGSYPSMLVMQVNGGGMDEVLITDDTTGKFVHVQQAFTADADDEGLIIDHTSQLVTLTGVPIMNKLAPGSEFFVIEPGESHNIIFQTLGSTPTGTPTLTVSHSSGYLG